MVRSVVPLLAGEVVGLVAGAAGENDIAQQLDGPLHAHLRLQEADRVRVDGVNDSAINVKRDGVQSRWKVLDLGMERRTR